MSKKAVNWNDVSELDKALWDQNVRQFWVDTEIPISDDKLTWKLLNDNQKDTYKKILGGLTFLDTQQGGVGIPNIAIKLNNLHQKSVLSFMGMMEHMHAKSYSSIFSTLCQKNEIDDLFNWVDNNPLLNEKLKLILNIYNNINTQNDLALAMGASVMLESFLFYSGFFYSLYLSGNGMLSNSNEIINLIIRDESIHGAYIGKLYKDLEKNEAEVEKSIDNLFTNLYEIEKEYNTMLYSNLRLDKEADIFIKYNANKAFRNLGLENRFNITDNDVNPLVLKGLDTTTKTHDFFSKKGNGYIKPMKSELISDDDFNM